jgi:hypothetical protein
MSPSIRSVLVLAVLLLLASTAAQSGDEVAEYTYAIEVNGVVCGYADVTVSKVVAEGRPYTEVKHQLFTMRVLLGAQVNTNVESIYHVDPVSGQFFFMSSHVTQGELKIDSRVEVEGDTARCYSSLTGKESMVPVSDGTIFQDPLYARYLLRDFEGGETTEKTYYVFSPLEFEIQPNVCTGAGLDTLALAGESFEAVAVDIQNSSTGLKTRWWMNTADGAIVKIDYGNGQVAYRADPSIRNQIEPANVDRNIMTKTNVDITDVPGISYMKVRARIKPTGLWVEPDGLNVPGQSFVGTVEDNLVEGVFEVEHPRYDGTGAPPYPPAFEDEQSLSDYLNPTVLVESDDPVLIEKATELAEGSADSWEAACRLSRWVAENIGYAIPGGGTARKVYDLRAGECGGHSFLLATFCRAVGIPARVVWGCMYTPGSGGAFGQHAWNEIYMGEAGWIPVDVTAMETDFVDSGHIRIGAYESLATALNAEEMEILDYRTASDGSHGEAFSTLDKYQPYVGEYRHARGGDIFEVLINNGSLAVDIPNKMVLGFNDPDEDGKWRCKLSNSIYCTFPKDKHGRVKEMVFHEVARMPRQSEPNSVDGGVPEELRPYLGGYYFGALQAEFVVSWGKRRLTLYDPSSDATIPLEQGDEEGTWIDGDRRFMISFETDDDGKVLMLTLDAANRFRKE